MLHRAARFRILRGGRVRELSDLAIGSKLWCRRRSFAASVTSDAPADKSTKKRVPKDERRAMVELSVNKYRSKNLGKFPTPSYVMKEVGGSYYTVKKMLQELEYNSKLSSLNKGNETQVVSLPGDDMLSEKIANAIVKGDDSKNDDTERSKFEEIATLHPMKSKDFEDKATYEILLDIDRSKSILEVNQLLPESSCPKKPPDFVNETLRESIDFDGPKSIAEQHTSPEILVPKKPEDMEEEEHYQSLHDIDGSKSKSVVHQPLPEISREKCEDVKVETISVSGSDFDDSISKAEEHHPLPQYPIPKKPENIIEEEPYQTVPVTDGLKSKGEVQKPLTEISYAKKLEDVKEETSHETVLSFKDLKSKFVEDQPSAEYSVPKKTDNIKEAEPYQTMGIDSSKSKAVEHKMSESKSSGKQAEKDIQIKTSLWGNLKSVAEGIINMWRKQ